MSTIDEMEMHEIQGKADAANAMMNSAVFNEAFTMMNQGIVDQILQTPVDAPAERERLFSMFKAGQMFGSAICYINQQLRVCVNNRMKSKMAESNIELSEQTATDSLNPTEIERLTALLESDLGRT